MMINVQIERLVLDGVPVTGQQVPWLRRALTAELGRLLARTYGEGVLTPPAGAVPVLRTPMAAPATAGTGSWGEHIAAAVHGVMLR